MRPADGDQRMGGLQNFGVARPFEPQLKRPDISGGEGLFDLPGKRGQINGGGG